MKLVTTWFGVFIMEDDKVLEHTLFPKGADEIAKRMMAIQKGMAGGREREKIRHVTNTADVTGFASLKVKRASVVMPKRKTIAIKTTDLHPKR